MIANLIEKKWLWRKLHVVTADGVFEVIYNGRGTGYEEVLVDGAVAQRLPSLVWYVPQFDFTVGNIAAQINVKVSPMLQISRFDLHVGDTVVYEE